MKKIFINILIKLNVIMNLLTEVLGGTVLIFVLILGYYYNWNFSEIFYLLSLSSNQEILKVFGAVFLPLYLIKAVFKIFYKGEV